MRLQLARSAAELEESMDKSAVTPGAVTPGAAKCWRNCCCWSISPKQSLAEYQSVLKIAPNRFNALYGAARAAEAAGDAECCRKLLSEADPGCRGRRAAGVEDGATEIGGREGGEVIGFVNRNEDLQELLRKVTEPIKGTQYFLPLGGQDAVGA